jgi:hypothetical protein
MDEIAESDLAKVRALWAGPTASAAKAKATRRSIERQVRKSSEFWTGRSAQLNIRMTPDLKTEVQAAVAKCGMSMAEFFETAMLEFISKRRAKP